MKKWIIPVLGLLLISACDRQPDIPNPDTGPLAGLEIPDPMGPSTLDNPCINIKIDPLGPDEDLIDLIRKCPFRELDIPELQPVALPAAPATAPDLIITLHQSVVHASDAMEHYVKIKNIGNADSVIGPSQSDTSASIQFYVSDSPMLEGVAPDDYGPAGGWSLPEQVIVPGGEIELRLKAGSGTLTGDLTGYNYAIGQLWVNPSNDANPDNNLSVTALVPG